MSVTVRDNSARAKRAISSATKKSLLLIAADLQGQASLRAPIDLGDLRGSFSSSEAVDKSEINAGSVRVGSNLPYAVKQHEDLTLNHPGGGEAKYLEGPAAERQGMYERMVGQALRIEVNGA